MVFSAMYSDENTSVSTDTETDKKILGISISILNGTHTFEDVPLDGDFYWLLTCLFLCIVWFSFILFYNSRIFGFLLTRLLNHVILPRYVYPNCKREVRPYIHVGSFSITFISGKVMFRDFIFITPDYSIRIQDGFFILRWWVPYQPMDIRTFDFSTSDTRLSVYINGLEFHLYNMSETYTRLLKIFGLQNQFHMGPDGPTPAQTLTENLVRKLCGTSTPTNDDLIKAYRWRDFFPVTKFEISDGRIVFGNHLLPTTLLLTFDDAWITYSSKPAFSPQDLFTHIAKCRANSMKVILANSPLYEGLREDPPRFMGEGFVVFQSNQVDFYYYQDEPGLVEGDGAKELQKTAPAWGVEMKSGKGTDLRYGPWADRQREALYNFFYPLDFQQIPVDYYAKPGQFRVFRKFDFRFSTLASANIDILFSDSQKDAKVMHLSAGPGSYLEVSAPLVSQEHGYHSEIVGQILHLDSSTTLAYRQLVESETLEFRVRIQYPRMWNHHQIWTVKLTGCKITAHLLFEHKFFFQHLIDDWAGTATPDILTFVPYTVKINLKLKEFEMILLANEHNWIDCDQKSGSENVQLAICGETFELAFDLPFSQYLPPKIPFVIWIQGDSLEAAFCVPESNPHYTSIQVMHRHAKLSPVITYNSCKNHQYRKFLNPNETYAGERKWPTQVSESNGWITCWSVPLVALSITYHFHPVPPRREIEQDKFDCLTTPFDPTQMTPDLMEVELEIGPSNICLYGFLFRILWNIKENYMGESQFFTDLASKLDNLDQGNGTNASFTGTSTLKNEPVVKADERLYRPFSVTVSVIMHELHGHLIRTCYEAESKIEDSVCSLVYLDRLCFEMDKSYEETKLQLILSPVTARICPILNVNLAPSQEEGHLSLSSLQFRGHASFSGLGRPLSSETLEYSWLVELEIGKLSGLLSPPQLFHLTMALEQFVYQMVQEDTAMQPPIPYRKCLHDRIQLQCPDTDANLNKLCPYAEDLKYKMFRLSFKSIDLFLIEKRSLLNFLIAPIKFSTCNLHSCNSNDGMTLLINQVLLRHLIQKPSNSASSNNLKNFNFQEAQWLEVMRVNLGPIFVDTAQILSIGDSYTLTQKTFLSLHDTRTKRLWFLWPEVANQNLSLGKCGCVGGCTFFGSNLNGMDFFNLNAEIDLDAKRFMQKKNFYSKPNRDFLYGESLLRPGEPMVGFRLNSIYEEDEQSFDCEQTHPIDDLISVPEDLDAQSVNASINSPVSCRKVQPIKARFACLSKDLSFSMSPPIGIRGHTRPFNTVFNSNRSIQGQKLNDQSRSMSESGIGSRKLKNFKYSSTRPEFMSKMSSDTEFKAKTKSDIYATEESDNEMEEIKKDNSEQLKERTSKSMLSMDKLKQTSQSSLCKTIINPSRSSLFSTTSAPVESGNMFDEDDEVLSRQAESDTDAALSTSSFISAQSSLADLSKEKIPDLETDEPIAEENLDEQQAYESLLSNIYTNYLTPYELQNEEDENKFSLPKFRKMCNVNFSNLALKRRRLRKQFTKDSEQTDDNYFPGKVYEHMSEELENQRKEKFLKTHKRQDSSEKVISLGKLEKQICKTMEFRSEKLTVLIKLTGTTRIHLSPPCFEGISTFLESLKPVLQVLHPLLVVNHVSLMCGTHVGQKNALKKEKTLEYGQMKLKAFRSTLEREQVLFKPPAPVQPLANASRSTFFDKPKPLQQSTVITANQYEDTKSTRTQLFVQLSEIQLLCLQAGWLEPPNIKNETPLQDISCVSLFAVSISSANIDFYSNRKERRSLHTFITNNAQTPPTSVFAALAQKDLVSRIFSRKPKKQQKEIEPLTIETQELLQQEQVAMCKVESVHMQLQRLQNQCSLLDDALLTVIPSEKSKVSFEYIVNDVDCSLPVSTNRNYLRRQECVFEEHWDSLNNGRSNSQEVQCAFRNGFIMFEAGLEDIHVNAMKRQIVMDDKLPVKLEDEKATDMEGNTEGKPNTKPEGETSKVFEKSTELLDSVATYKNGASSFIGELGLIWFNFAAPPWTPNTKKIDFTRLDWHLISTANPALSAWLQVGDRMFLHASQCFLAYERRVTSILACLMSSALDVQAIHVPPAAKYLVNKLTPFAKAMHEDPSCQLMHVLKRYIHLKHKDGFQELEQLLLPAQLPPLKDLRRGIIALSRQWKNALYMPLLVEQNIRHSRRAQFAQAGSTGKPGDNGIPLRMLINEEGDHFKHFVSPGSSPSKEHEMEMEEDTDETTNLLSSEMQSPTNVNLNSYNSQQSDKKVRSTDESHENIQIPAPINRKARPTGFSTLPSMINRSARGSLGFPLLVNPLESLGTGVNRAYDFLFSPSCATAGSTEKKKLSTFYPNGEDIRSSSSSLGTPDHDRLFKQSIENCDKTQEQRLLWWALGQQDYTIEKHLQAMTRDAEVFPPYMDPADVTKHSTLCSAVSDEDPTFAANSIDILPGFVFVPTGIQLGDVRIIFEPLLDSLGVASLTDDADLNMAAFEQLGPKISLSLSIKLFKVEIVEAAQENSKFLDKKRSNPRQHIFTKLHPPSGKGTEAPAFDCHKLNISLDLRKVKDFRTKEEAAAAVAVSNTFNTNEPLFTRSQSGGAESNNPQVAEEKLPIVIMSNETNHNDITTVVNFNVDVNKVNQKVNLPLLRLIHQVASVCENVKDVRQEMKAKKPQEENEEESEFCVPEPKIELNNTNGEFRIQIDQEVPEQIDDGKPKCWKKLYYLLSLYDSPAVQEEEKPDEEPENEILNHVPISVVDCDAEAAYISPLATHPAFGDTSMSSSTPPRKSMLNVVSTDQIKTYTQELMLREQTPLIIFGVAKIRRVNLEAKLSGLKLDGELSHFHISLTHREKMKGAPPSLRRWKESSLTAQLGASSIQLLEEVQPPELQLVVKVSVGKSHSLLSAQNKKGKDLNSALLSIGAIHVHIPQHPVALHGMMTRSSRQLSTTLQEFKTPRGVSVARQSSTVNRSESGSSARSVRLTNAERGKKAPSYKKAQTNFKNNDETDSVLIEQQFIKPIVVQFTVLVDSLKVGASLLPSLTAQYYIGQITSSGVSGHKARFTVEVREHLLSFNTRLQHSNTEQTNVHLPTSASVSLPPIHLHAEYMEDSAMSQTPNATDKEAKETLGEGVVLRKGSYLNALADIGSFEHCLTTDLLNHLLLVQKVFMKEINEILQKMAGATESTESAASGQTDTKSSSSAQENLTSSEFTNSRHLLFSCVLRMKGVQITATTPTNSAVRLETGAMELQLSNRVQNLQNETKNSQRLFLKLQVSLTVALGQLFKNPMFEEADPEFQQLAYFRTRIMARNALQDELIFSASNEGPQVEKEALLITLNQPLLYLHPIALDKAVLVWLNYKNAYEYWNEQRAVLNTEVLSATQQVLERVQAIPDALASEESNSTLFLQLTVQDLGVCLPLNVAAHAPLLRPQPLQYVSELKSAFVITLENTTISACSSGSWASKANFTDLCIRFADDFETSLDDWKPDPSDPTVMNVCVVSKGTYEICSRTTAPGQVGVHAKWLLNVSWKMEGFDIHVDVSIGKQLSSLFNTLTALAGEEEDFLDSDEEINPPEDEVDLSTQTDLLNSELINVSKPSSRASCPPASSNLWRKSSLLRGQSVSTRERSRLIEQELNEQVRLINDLRASGASEEVIDSEIRRFNELETFVFNNFKRDVMKKLRRQSMKNKPSAGTIGRQFSTQVSVAEESELGSFESNLGSRENEQKGTEVRYGPTRSSTTASATQYVPVQEPNIDFELDVKVFFNSGKCVLHTKDVNCKSEAEDPFMKKGGSLGKDAKLGVFDVSNGKTRPLGKTNTNANPLRSNISSSRLKTGIHGSNMLDYTVFLIPGLDIKIHYTSKTIFPDESESRWRRSGQKKASLYAWMTLHGIPEETLITPHLLDFLEQALEPIPLEALRASNRFSSTTDEGKESNPGTLGATGGPELITSAPAQYAVYGSFPVDVIVYLHVQPSALRFSCLPVSRVECLLQLPSVDLVFSSKRIEEELGGLNYGPTPAGKSAPPPYRSHRRMGSDFRHQAGDPASVGGLSVTGYLADFSLYIFHPYTNKKSAPQNEGTSPNSGSPKTRIERKDSLSLQVEFVKLNISRTRKLVFVTDSDSVISRSAIGRVDKPKQKIVIQFSGLCDVGSASFKYDIRRLTEILAFPKAWYRKVLWKRVFLGEQGVSNDLYLLNQQRGAWAESDQSSGDEMDTPSTTRKFELGGVRLRREARDPAATKGVDELKRRSNRGAAPNVLPSELCERLLNTPWETLILFGVNLRRLSVSMNMGNVMGQTAWVTRGLRSDGCVIIDSTGHRQVQVGVQLEGSTLDAKGGIVGGQIDLNAIETKLHSQEYHGREPHHIISIKANALETRVDYMGSAILMLRCSALDCTLRDEWKIDPITQPVFSHPTKRPALLFIHCTLSWDQLQVLISRSTTPDLLKISHKLEEFFSQQFHSGRRALGQLQQARASHRSSLQRNSSILSQAGSVGSTASDTPEPGRARRPLSQSGLSSAASAAAKHHRHWQKPLKAVSGARLATLPSALPQIGTILGGTFELNGNNISLACFAGVNFRSKSWAVFSLRHPHISFATEAQDIVDDAGSQATHIVQNFSLGLGRKAQQEGYSIDLLYAQHSSMATVCRISRSMLFPPQFRHLHEWFAYAFASSELDEVHRFPLLQAETTSHLASPSPSPITVQSTNQNNNLNSSSVEESKPEGVSSSNVVSGVANVVSGMAASLGASFQTSADSNNSGNRKFSLMKTTTNPALSAASAHNKEIIFALPSLQLELKTEHVQGSSQPGPEAPRARVDCAFVTDFDDHIFVAVDVEAYFFLHDLIASYIKEKENTTGKAQQSPNVATIDRNRSKNSRPGTVPEDNLDEDRTEKDWRDYCCQTWHLEPTVRLLSWAGKNIEPYGVDYILQRLGFTQARITIPKWIQRGAMDPFDRVLSELMYQILIANQNNTKALK